MRLTPEYTTLSPAAITGIRDLGMNAIIICKDCVKENDRGNFIHCRTPANVAEKSLDWMLGKN